MPGSPVVTGDCRSWVVPKLWLDLLGRGGLSSEGLQQPGQGGWESQRSERDRRRWTGMAEKRQGAGWQELEVGGRGLGPDTYHGHMASLPPGCWGRSRARRQEVDTAKELRGSREEKEGGQVQGRRERKDMVRDSPGAEVTVGRQSPGSHPGPPPRLPIPSWAPQMPPDSQRPSYLKEH